MTSVICSGCVQSVIPLSLGKRVSVGSTEDSTEIIDNLIDIAGNKIVPGDYITYIQMSGRSAQVVLGKLIKFTGPIDSRAFTGATVQRLGGGRWSASYARTRYRDKRTGNGIDIWSVGFKHWEIPPSTTYVHKVTGAELTEEEFRNISGANWTVWHDYNSRYNPGTHKDYVEAYADPSPPVTLKVLANVMKAFPTQEVIDELEATS